MSKGTFNYTYSASQQEEIKKIREKYSAPEEQEDKMEQLRRLDRNVTKPGTVISLIIGIVSALVMGTGMSMCMVWGEDLFILGIIVGIIGMIGIISAYPLYSAITKSGVKSSLPRYFVYPMS